MLMGTAEVLQAPSKPIVFAEDLPDAQRAMLGQVGSCALLLYPRVCMETAHASRLGQSWQYMLHEFNSSVSSLRSRVQAGPDGVSSCCPFRPKFIYSVIARVSKQSRPSGLSPQDTAAESLTRSLG